MQLNMCFNFLVLLTCVDQTDNLPTSKQNAFQHVLTKRLICQRGHKIRVHASGETNCISTFFVQTYQVSAKPPNASHNAFTDPSLATVFTIFIFWRIPSHASEDKMHLNALWTNPSHSSEDTNVSQHECPKQCHAREDKKCYSTCVHKPLPCQRGHYIHFNKLTIHGFKCIATCI